MEVEMQRAEQLAAAGPLSAAITHETRNPLASISPSTQLLRSKLVLEESTQRLVDTMAREIDRLNAILTDFLAAARPQPLPSQPFRSDTKPRTGMQELLIGVEDTGPRMPPEVRKGSSRPFSGRPHRGGTQRAHRDRQPTTPWHHRAYLTTTALPSC